MSLIKYDFEQGLPYVMFGKNKQAQPSFVVVNNGAECVQIRSSLLTSMLLKYFGMRLEIYMSFRFISWYVMSYTGIFHLYETKLFMICEFRLIPECSLLKPEIFSKKNPFKLRNQS